MMALSGSDQLAALRTTVFGAIDDWNAAHPHPLNSHHEHGSISMTVSYADASGAATYAVKVVCSLSGSPQLTFHGHDLGAVAEHARLTLEHRIDAELQLRATKLDDDEFDRRYGVAV